MFVGLPFVIRAVQPVLEKLDGQYEEAAYMLGASPSKTFRRVILPELRPAILTGFVWHLPEELVNTAVSFTYRATVQKKRHRLFPM